MLCFVSVKIVGSHRFNTGGKTHFNACVPMRKVFQEVTETFYFCKSRPVVLC